jgi:HD-GYP domain-containing protein (c-di-GMP phosphodiesterase class II)
MVHDLGRSGVPNTIWDKPGPLTFLEWERVRLHPYYTERILARVPALARVAAIAVAHHERLDGSGYHRGLSGGAIGPSARLLAAADANQAMSQVRAYRPVVSAEHAAAVLRADVRAGRLAGDAVERFCMLRGSRPDDDQWRLPASPFVRCRCCRCWHAACRTGTSPDH